MSTPAVALPRHLPAWRAARTAGIVLLGVLLVGLVTAPALALHLLWNLAVPVLPATFLVNTAIWRNVCPLATLSLLPGAYRGRGIDGSVVRATAIVGILLFLLLVPARRFLFNGDGPALAVAIVTVGGVALAAGFAFQRKAGFCNTICPVHPVERLYGQRPLLPVANMRCVPCINCTSRGCIDRSPSDSLRNVLGTDEAHRWWIASPFGYFAAGLPGFVVGFYTLDNVAPDLALDVYRHIALTTGASVAAIVFIVGAARLNPVRVMPVIAAAAVGLYYWFASPAITSAWHLPPTIGTLIRVAALTLVGFWLIAALRAVPDRSALWPR